jgi:hypothetical protein
LPRRCPNVDSAENTACTELTSASSALFKAVVSSVSDPSRLKRRPKSLNDSIPAPLLRLDSAWLMSFCTARRVESPSNGPAEPVLALKLANWREVVTSALNRVANVLTAATIPARLVETSTATCTPGLAATRSRVTPEIASLIRLLPELTVIPSMSAFESAAAVISLRPLLPPPATNVNAARPPSPPLAVTLTAPAKPLSRALNTRCAPSLPVMMDAFTPGLSGAALIASRIADNELLLLLKFNTELLPFTVNESVPVPTAVSVLAIGPDDNFCVADSDSTSTENLPTFADGAAVTLSTALSLLDALRC